MKKQTFKCRTAPVCWRQFTRKRNAAFLSLGKEIRICTLSAATLLFAVPKSAQAQVVTNIGNNADESKVKTEMAEISVLEEGDLLFNVANTQDGLTGAITNVTQGYAQERISHVAIVCHQPNGVFALEASLEDGVRLNPIDSFIQNAEHSADGSPLILVGRLKDQSQASSSVKKALTYLGRPYDYLYSSTEDEIYCSELVQISYKNSDGSYIFAQQPMSFHDNTGQITPYWIEHYAKRGLTVPEGEPGTNPGGISQSDAITIYKFKQE